jgi:hypothetical protein
VDEVTAIHTLARSYLKNRWDQGIAADYALRMAEPEPGEPSGEIVAARLCQEIADEVERYVPEDFRSPEEAKATITSCAHLARREHLEVHDRLAPAAVEDAELAFCTYVEVLDDRELISAQPIPYRRRLGDDEVREVERPLWQRWGVVRGVWYPDFPEGSDAEYPEGVEVYGRHRGWWLEPSVDVSTLGPLFSQLSGGRYFELYRGMNERSREIESLDFFFDGANDGVYYLPRDGSWLAHLNADSVLAVAGPELLALIHDRLPEWKEGIYWPRPG